MHSTDYPTQLDSKKNINNILSNIPSPKTDSQTDLEKIVFTENCILRRYPPPKVFSDYYFNNNSLSKNCNNPDFQCKLTSKYLNSRGENVSQFQSHSPPNLVL